MLRSVAVLCCRVESCAGSVQWSKVMFCSGVVRLCCVRVKLGKVP